MSTRRRKRHSPEQIIAKLRDVDAMLNSGKDLAVVLQALEVSESTYELVSDFVIAEEKESLKLKGRNEPFLVYEVSGLK